MNNVSSLADETKICEENTDLIENQSPELRNILFTLLFEGGIKSFFEHSLRVVMVEKLAAERELLVQDEELQQCADSYRSQYGLNGKQETRNFLEKFDLDIDDFTNYCEHKLLENKLMHQILDDQFIQDFFESNRKLFERANLALIQVSREVVAEEVLRKYRAKKISFGDLAKEYSIHGSQYKRGRIGLKFRHEFSEGLANKMFDSAPGSLVGPVKRQDLWEIYRVEEFLSARLDTETKNYLRQQLFRSWLREKIILNKLR